MKRLLFPLFFVLALSCSGGGDLSSRVDPMIGAGGHGHVFVGAGVPFGMVQLGPTQITHGWDWCSGYSYQDSIILGFSHTHLSGTGVGDLGDITLLPFDPARRKHVSGRLCAGLDHSLEAVSPGFYSVELPDYGVKVRLTAGTYTGYHEYTFSGDSSAVLLDLDTGVGWDNLTGWEIETVNDRTVRGFRRSSGWAKDQTVYYYAMFSQPFIMQGDEDSPLRELHFDTSSEKTLHVVVGISPTSAQKALDNIGADTRKGNNFEKNAAYAREQWNKVLGKITIKPLDEKQEKVFYTALYHCMIAPARFSDASDPELYTVFSLWDVYRAAFPLYTIIDTAKVRAFGKSFMDIYEKSGELPVWHLWGNETDCMPGNAGVVILGDLVLKGLYDDVPKALEAMVASSNIRDRGQQDILDYGYIPYDATEQGESVSKALEFAVSYSSVAKVAELAGDGAVAAAFREKAGLYRKYYDPSTGFLRGVAKDGSFRTPYNPFDAGFSNIDYTEGNGWQYTFMVPHDVPGLIGLLGGKDRFVQKLDSLFTAQGDMGDSYSDVTGLIGQYAHGNEPCHHMAYMYDMAGRPDKCQKIVRTIMDSLYFDTPEGLCGNEDVGQMSAWYVLSALGLYQVDPCSKDLWLGSPSVMEATVNGNFKIVARGNSKENIYVKSVKLNGKSLGEPRISYDDIMAGGPLEFEMTDKPQ